MNRQIRCRVSLAKLGPTSRNLLTGFALLARQGLIELTQEMTPVPPNLADGPLHLRDKASWMIYLVVDDHKRACIDLSDGNEIDPAAQRECDVYFKRSLHLSSVPESLRAKLRPFGLVYDNIYLGYDPFALWRKLHMNAPLRIRAAEVARWFKRPLAAALGRGDRTHFANSATVPQTHQPARLLFLTRLIDPADFKTLSGDSRADYEAMNEMRVQCVRQLRREFGPQFLGGVEASEFAQRHFPDIVASSPGATKHRTFLELVRQHPICVSTSGPRRSPAFDLAAYTGASRAIVSEAISSELPGNFAPDVNYLSFTTPAQCVEQAQRLIADPVRVRAQMRANWAYHNTWVRADALAMRVIDETMECA
jgi:hypothetical protein